MGLIHGYDIYLRPRNVARALANLAELAAPGRAVPPLEVTLPGGARIVLPFTSRFESDPVDCSTGGTLELDMSLTFAVDDALREYEREGGPAPRTGGHMRIGYIYATIRFESFLYPDYASVECWAATSRMSRLFGRSGSVREAFAGLAAASGAVCCLFDTGDGAPERVCWLSGEPVRGGATTPALDIPARWSFENGRGVFEKLEAAVEGAALDEV